jgi:Fic family protein
MGQGDMGQSQSDRPKLMLLPVDSVNERQRLVINRMLNGFEGFLSTSKYAQLAKCSTDTALRDVRELLRRVQPWILVCILLQRQRPV